MRLRAWIVRRQRELDAYIEAALEILRRRSAPTARQRHSLDIGLLEDRVMLSASPLPVMVEAGGDMAPPDQPDELGFPPSDAEQSSADSAKPDATSSSNESTNQAEQTLRRELVFVDTSAQDYEQLVDDLLANNDGTRQFDVVLLETNQDGIEQISRELMNYDGLDAVHIVSHGTARSSWATVGSHWTT